MLTRTAPLAHLEVSLQSNAYFHLLYTKLSLHGVELKLEQTADRALGTCPTTEPSFLIATADGS